MNYFEIKKYFKTHGFSKEHGVYRKKIDDVFYLTAKIETVFNPPKQIGEKQYEATYKIKHDISAYICYENEVLLDVSQMLVFDEYNYNGELDFFNENKYDGVLDYFDKNIYEPLFVTKTVNSLYDFMCKLEVLWAGKDAVRYNDYDKAFQAYREKRFEEAMFCIKSIVFQNLAEREPYVLERENRSSVDDEKVNCLKAKYKDTWRWDDFTEIFDLYDKLRAIGVE